MVLATALLTVTACTSDPTAARDSSASDSLATDTSARGRAAFGCALERGTVDADDITRHYGHLAAHSLFAAALEDDHDFATAAYLWNASDLYWASNDERANSERLLKYCTAAGFDGTATLPELRSYMCAMIGDLVRERPTARSFGPQPTRATPGDPSRSDVSFVGDAQFLLAFEETKKLDFGISRLYLDDGDPSYQDALAEAEASCATD